jgi:dihydroflavonol-4-reductase
MEGIQRSADFTYFCTDSNNKCLNRQSMKILITGINGLAGSFIAKKMLSEGHEIFGLIREGSDLSLLADVKSQIKFEEGDILDVPNLYKSIEGKDWVIHCAAIVSYSPKDKAKIFKVNVEGTANVVNACIELGVIKLAYLSSIAAIGKETPKNLSDSTVITEQNEWNDNITPSNYAKSKYLAELEVWRGVAEGLDAIILNPSVIIGEADWSKSSTRLFKYVYDQNTFYTDGLLSYIDAADLALAVSKLLNSDIINDRFIVSAGAVPYKLFFDKTALLFNKKSPSIKLGSFASEILWRIEAIRSKLLGNEPLITKETAQSAKKMYQYSSQKLINAIDIDFKPLDISLQRICNLLLEKSKKGLD